MTSFVEIFSILAPKPLYIKMQSLFFTFKLVTKSPFLSYYVRVVLRPSHILARSIPPLEICRWFPQIVFILSTRVRPINVGFSNVFFLSDKRFLNIIIKIFLKKINLRVRFLLLKIAFF